MYECPSCGAGLVFNPKSQMLECNYCNEKYNPKDLEKLHLKDAKKEKGISFTKDEETKSENNLYDAIVYRCTQCGAELITTDETIATFCSYCGSSAVLEKRNEKKEKPSYVIPFTKTKEECEKAYKNKLRKSFFAPNNMIQTQQVEKIRGIYMPYWIYSFDYEGKHTASGSKCKGRIGDYVYYDDYTIKTNLSAKCDGITHDATSNFADNLSEAISPFSMNEKQEFSPTYLSGFYADSEDVKGTTYRGDSNKIADEQISKDLMKDPIYRKYGSRPYVHLNNKDTKLGLFPVYFLATKNKKGDRISYAVVNGQTGKVAAEIPIDFKKFIIASLLLAVPIFFLLNGFLTLTPIKALIGAIIFSIISLLVLNKQVNQIYLRENRLDDKGNIEKSGDNDKETSTVKKQKKSGMSNGLKIFIIFWIVFTIAIPMYAFIGKMSFLIGLIISILIYALISGNSKSDNKKAKIKFKDKIKKLFKPIIALIIAIVILIINPVSDIYYYAGAIISILMTIWSFADIVKQINLLTTRKLPQLGRRGGDENA